MRARASFKGHAFHQMLTPFPLAFLLGALLFDLAGVVLGRPSFWTTGAHLAVGGVATALLAAAPGLIDLLGSVPPKSSAKTRGLQHAAANLSATVLFAVAWLLRGEPSAAPGMTVLVAESLGAALLVMGSWMGGTLVARNQIAIDHRYARAGKWRERRIEGRKGQALRVAERGELEVDQMMLLHVGGRRIVLGRTEAGYVAFADACPHRGASLADGAMICGTVQCPWHGSQFDVKTGACKAGPAEKGIEVYEVREGDDGVELVV